MGLFFRRSVSMGPVRFNFSGSGVGLSVGVPGFRVGTGPRGHYVHLGAGGAYYRQTFPSEPPAHVRLPSVTTAMQEIESSSAAQIVDSSSEALLQEIRDKRSKIALTPFVTGAGAAMALFAAIKAPAPWLFWLVVIVAVALIVVARHQDKLRKTVVITYDFDPAVQLAWERFAEWAGAVAKSARTWHIAASGHVRDPKYHAGASQLVQRSDTTFRTQVPPHIVTNVPVLSLGAGRQTLYFLPDRLLVYDSAGVGAIGYRTLAVSVTPKRFIEEGGTPRDAKVVDRTWRYVNKSGGPDRRFSNNRQIPICLYDELHLWTESGLNEVFQISRPGVCDGFAAAVRHLASVTA
ncbi:MAG TPA: DUF4236 domain-containing protein [Thermoanaerobaculia bacterium]|nr:DUF4236 domain-containing protein [Thermoanaerobaculia bacterium]